MFKPCSGRPINVQRATKRNRVFFILERAIMLSWHLYGNKVGLNACIAKCKTPHISGLNAYFKLVFAFSIFLMKLSKNSFTNN